MLMMPKHAEIAEPQIESSFQQKKSYIWFCLLMTLVVVAISAAIAFLIVTEEMITKYPIWENVL